MCFGTVIVGLVMLFFSPGLLLMPFGLLFTPGVGMLASGVALFSAEPEPRAFVPVRELPPAVVESAPLRLTGPEPTVRPDPDRADWGPRPSPNPGADKDKAPWGTITVVILLAALGIWIASSKTAPSGLSTSPATPQEQASPGSAADAPPKPPPNFTHAVAAFKANLRVAPSAASKTTRTLERGTPLVVLGEAGAFVNAQLQNGTSGFIAQELLIPMQDLERLQSLSARDYVAGGQRSEQVQLVMRQLQTAVYTDAYGEVLTGLVEASPRIGELLQRMPTTRSIAVVSDLPAATWFGLEAALAAKERRYADASVAALASFGASPTDGERLVALVLADYQRGETESVIGLGGLAPLFGPARTNSWMLLGLSRSMGQQRNDPLAQRALVLAVRLSRNPETTRKYLHKLIADTLQPEVAANIQAALDEERDKPGLFADVAVLGAAPDR